MTEMQSPSLPERFARAIALLSASLWVGSMWGVGFLAVPVLFHTLPDKMLAGMLAGKMFSLVAYVGMACAAYLLSWLLARHGKHAWRQPLFLITASMLVLVLIGECGLQPQMAALKAQVYPQDVTQSAVASRFGLLHHIASTLYVIQSILGIPLLLKTKGS